MRTQVGLKRACLLLFASVLFPIMVAAGPMEDRFERLRRRMRSSEYG